MLDEADSETFLDSSDRESNTLDFFLLARTQGLASQPLQDRNLSLSLFHIFSGPFDIGGLVTEFEQGFGVCEPFAMMPHEQFYIIVLIFEVQLCEIVNPELFPTREAS
ncbi:MAG: hypothetical protein WBQ86_13160 [Candidatus Binatus sp.]